MTPEQQEELLKRYVAPHNIVSRPVEEKDIHRVIEESGVVRELCSIKRGFYPAAFALAHSQICDNDPLAFFVPANGGIVLNPAIIRHVNYTVTDLEGCLSFPDAMPIDVIRWPKIEAEFYTLDNAGRLVGPVRAKLRGIEAKIFQHELAHIFGGNIYDNDYERFIINNYTYGGSLPTTVRPVSGEDQK
jgi:hypothetical protein